MKARRRWLAGILATLLLAAITSPWWLPWPAEFLVDGDPPSKSDAIIVLAGDGNGYRVQAAAELAREGYAPVVLVSGSDWFYGLCECDIAIDFAVRNGQPREIFEPFRMSATSTDEETLQLLREANRRNWKSVMFVTSDYHTRRTRILANRHKFPSQTVTVFGAPDRYFRADQWWWHRESRKIFFLEWAKTVAVAMGGL